MSGEAETVNDGAAAGNKPRRRLKTVVGVVTSDKMNKTRTVSVTRLERHVRYGKYVQRRTKYKARDDKEISHEGDVVRIAESTPIAKTVNWRLVEVVERARLGPGQAPTQTSENDTPGEGAS
jgi:small subunit ribosomal protein S17